MTPVDRLLRLINDRYGLLLKDHFRSTLSKQLSEMSRARRIEPDTLVTIAANKDDILRELTGRLTIGESFFYRHPEQLHSLVREILERRRAFDNRSAILIWSAGCSDGQEPYSIAIAVTEHLMPPERDQIRIIASDVNPAAIERAKQGIYNTWSFRGLSDDLRDRYFTALSDGRFALKEAIRKRVTFTCASVQEQAATFDEGAVDFIFFRNVLIYLDRNSQHDIYERFRHILHPNGLLFTAPSDQIPPRDAFCLLNDTDTSAYVSVPGRAGAAEPSVRMSRNPTIGRYASPTARAVFPTSRPVVDGAPPAASSRKMDSNPFDAHMESGQRHLENDRSGDAVDDFRQAVFSQPNDPLPRFWYAVSLQRNGVPKRSLIQLNNLRTTLKQMSPDTLLSDGKTTADELLRATLQLQERLS